MFFGVLRPCTLKEELHFEAASRTAPDASTDCPLDHWRFLNVFQVPENLPTQVWPMGKYQRLISTFFGNRTMTYYMFVDQKTSNSMCFSMSYVSQMTKSWCIPNGPCIAVMGVMVKQAWVEWINFHLAT